jgi:hypothetical protein
VPSSVSKSGRAERPRPAFDALKRFQPLRRQLRSHFLFEIGGQSIAYCYIRKNACSAFKRMILDQAGYDGAWEDAIQFLLTLAPPSLSAARAAKWRIYVHRDPFERAVSLFRNKLVMREGDRDFIPDFERVTGQDADEATFEQFVTAYLAGKPRDPHTWSQASHLLPMSYNCVATLATLFEDMRPIVGEELAGRYFAKPANQSSAALHNETSFDVPVRLLRERYAETGELPSNAALDEPGVRAIVRGLYADDYHLAPKSA